MTFDKGILIAQPHRLTGRADAGFGVEVEAKILQGKLIGLGSFIKTARFLKARIATSKRGVGDVGIELMHVHKA